MILGVVTRSPGWQLFLAAYRLYPTDLYFAGVLQGALLANSVDQTLGKMQRVGIVSPASLGYSGVTRLAPSALNLLGTGV